MIPKFRAWHCELRVMMSIKNMWFQDNILEEIELNNAVANDHITAYPDEVKIMQSTGLTDKNGKEIFEGDIIDSTDGFLTGVVEFRVGLGMFVSELVEYDNFERLCNVASSRKIIGNIWEHPELAEVSS